MHLSDIHLNDANNNSLSDDIKDSLLEFIKKSNIKVDHLFITGDFREFRILNKVNPPERAENTANKVVKYIMRLSDVSSVATENIHIVPGNHDINIGPEDMYRIKEIEKYYSDDNDYFKEEDIEYLHERLEFFYHVYQGIYNDGCIWKDKLHYAVNREGVDVLFLNTALTCLRKRKQKLIIGGTSVREAFKDLKNEEICSPLFVLAHHSKSLIKEGDVEKLNRFWGNRTVFYLCGHYHNANIIFENNVYEIMVGSPLEGEGVHPVFCVGETVYGDLATLNFYEYKVIGNEGKWTSENDCNNIFKHIFLMKKFKDYFVHKIRSVGMQDITNKAVEKFFQEIEMIGCKTEEIEKSIYTTRFLWCFLDSNVIDEVCNLISSEVDAENYDTNNLYNHLQMAWAEIDEVINLNDIIKKSLFDSHVKEAIDELWKGGIYKKRYRNKYPNPRKQRDFVKFTKKYYGMDQTYIHEFFTDFENWLDRSSESNLFYLYGEKNSGKTTFLEFACERLSAKYQWIYVDCKKIDNIMSEIDKNIEYEKSSLVYVIILDNYDIFKNPYLDEEINLRKSIIRGIAVCNKYYSELKEKEKFMIRGFCEDVAIEYLSDHLKDEVALRQIEQKLIHIEFQNPKFLEIVCRFYNSANQDYIYNYIVQTYKCCINGWDFNEFDILEEEFFGNENLEEEKEDDSEEQMDLNVSEEDDFTICTIDFEESTLYNLIEPLVYFDDSRYKFYNNFVYEYLKSRYAKFILQNREKDYKYRREAKSYFDSNKDRFGFR